MNVCDHCQRIPKGKDANRKPFVYTLLGLKDEREIVRIELHICDICLTDFNKKLGQFVHAMKLNEDLTIQSNPDLPVGVMEHTELK